MVLMKNRKGVTMIEYALIAALISIAAVATITVVGQRVNTAFTNVKNNLPQ